MDLTVIDATGSKTPVSLPDTVDVDRIIPRLVQAMKLPPLGADGQALSYGLEHQRSGRAIDGASTLVQAGVREDDLLRLVAQDPVAETLAPAPVPARASSVGDYGYLPPTPAASAQTPASFPPAHAGHNRRRRVAFVAAPVAAILAVGVGAALATGALSGGSRHGHTRTTRQSATVSAALKAAPAPAGPTPSEQAGDRATIMSLLSDYANAYSAHNLSALSKLLAPEVSRHGLAAGGCTVAHGRGTVLGDYKSQFEEGSGAYTLVGLSEGQIQFNNTTQAYLNAHYRITPGGSGYVNFRFVDSAEAWKISEVYATCN
jgi:hypothetical protein